MATVSTYLIVAGQEAMSSLERLVLVILRKVRDRKLPLVSQTCADKKVPLVSAVLWLGRVVPFPLVHNTSHCLLPTGCV